MIEIIRAYRFTCDWPECRDHLTIHGAESIDDAKDRARRDDWTISKRASGEEAARCPSHAYRALRRAS